MLLLHLRARGGGEIDPRREAALGLVALLLLLLRRGLGCLGRLRASA